MNHIVLITTKSPSLNPIVIYFTFHIFKLGNSTISSFINRIISSQESMIAHQLQVHEVNLIYEMVFHKLNIKTLFVWTNKNSNE